MKKTFILFVLFFFIMCGIFFVLRTRVAFHQVVEDSKIATFPVHVLENRSFIYTQSFIGSVEAIQSVSVVPYLSAFLKEVYVQSGKEVVKGETLFLLDQKIPLADLNQAKDAVRQAYALRENAKIYYERMKKTDKNAISPVDLEQAKTQYEASEAAYQKAVAFENQAQSLYDYTIIKAPISGWVGNITATIGEYLSPESKTLATIVVFSPIRLVFSVPMSMYKGDYVTDDTVILQVVLADGRVLEFKKFKVFYDNQVDKSTDSISLFVDIPNDEKFLVPGAYVEVRFLYSKQGILVDKNWITLTPDGAKAVILKNGFIQKQNVKIGAPIGTQYWIQSGLLEGDQIVTVPVSPFQIGQPAEGRSQ